MVLAVIGVLVVNATAGRSVPGFAVPLSVPVPPAPGSCLLDTRAGWSAVSCTDPHTAEVVESSAADAGPQRALYEQCMAAGRAYLGDTWGQSGDGPTQVGWSIPPVMSNTVLIYGPGIGNVRGWSWRACAVRPTLLGAGTAGYRGRLRDVPATGVLPAELRPCFNRPGDLGVVGTSCSARHTGEVLAVRLLKVFGDTTAPDTTDTAPEVLAECLRLAGSTTAAADPTYGGRLQVVVNLRVTGMGFVDSTDPSRSASNSYVLYQASCALQAARGRQLSASVVGLGVGPPLLA